MSRASVPLAGFQVTLIGRFWVTPEDTQFFVGPQTVKGLYTFIAFRARGTDGWIRANASILVY